MYEHDSLHYYSIGFPSDRVSYYEVSRQIDKNKKSCLGKTYCCLYTRGNMNEHELTILLDYLGNTDGIHNMYFHTYNDKTRIETARIFMSFKEFKDAIDKDLESYRKANTAIPPPQDLQNIIDPNQCTSVSVSGGNQGANVIVDGSAIGTFRNPFGNRISQNAGLTEHRVNEPIPTNTIRPGQQITDEEIQRTICELNNLTNLNNQFL